MSVQDPSLDALGAASHPPELATEFTPLVADQWSGLPIQDGDEAHSGSIFPSGAEIESWHQGSSADQNLWTDGGADRFGRRSKPVSAIFIHAGAGYHSTANERIHLEACSHAARAAMKLLKGGASAIDAVEEAIRVLENKEITNAGYGSNLAIDGTVECDATIVDYLGRSGGCGAVPNIKNPISLAKLILERSSQPLSLRRVPPNLLIGDGAKEFAWKNGMALIPNDWLISRNARDRYVRWQEDLKRADMQSRDVTPSTPTKTPNPEYDEETHQKAQRDHTTAILTGTWNEGQPDSPVHPATPSDNGPPLAPHVPSPLKAQTPQSNGSTSSRLQDRSPLSFLGSKYTSKTDNSESPKTGSPDRKRPRFLERHSTSSPRNSDVGNPDAMDTGDGTGSLPNDRSTIPCLSDTVLKNLGTLVDPATAKEVEDLCTSNLSPASRKDSIFDGEYDEDMITDTVGAIAIDQDGHMAAGSSSGGIGMKHRGRVGPAALVGIGTAIIPADDSDRDSVTVGAVTSGTGEHMATTVAAQKCAERLYHGSVRGEGGFDVREDDESAIMESFIMHDFQLHPGVLNSSSAGAIGVMAVKQAPGGFYLYFAHNTDSFALASMGSSDRDPHCVMSRIDEKSRDRIAQGARKIRVD